LSPIPYVRGQVIALGALLAAAALLGGALVALCCAAFASASAALLAARYRHDLVVTGASVPPHRGRLDSIVSNDAWAALVPALLLALASLAFAFQPSGQAAVTACVAISYLSVAATAIYASSLVDWYVILPRISGQLGARPCQKADPDFPFPHSWKEVTRWWYIHRIVGTLVFRFMVGWAIAAVIGDLVGASTGAKFLGGLVMGIFATYLSATAAAVFQAGQAKAMVGQTIEVRARARRRRWPPFELVHPPELDGRQYVVDVSLEGVHLAGVRSWERDRLSSPTEFLRHPDRLDLVNLDSASVASRQFAGCEGRCSGINWYCLENPRCFEAK
jgi:hypothetical protein